MTDDRRDRFSIPYRPPDPEQAVAQYLNRSMHKLHVAEYHLREFERLEDELTSLDFFDFEREPFLPVQAHADGILVQLGAAFDAFACAVAHRRGCLDNAERASFSGHNQTLADAEPGELGETIRELGAAEVYEGLLLYRNLAAHRGVIGEQQRGSASEGGEEVRLHLPDWLPPEFPDFPGYPVRPILRRHVEWARPQIERLQEGAGNWQLEDVPSGEHVGQGGPDDSESAPRLRADPPTITTGGLPSPEERSPQFGEWRAWFQGEVFGVDPDVVRPPSWHLRRGDQLAEGRSALGLEVDGLRAWLENLAGREVAKAVLRHYRPREVQTTLGRALFPERET